MKLSAASEIAVTAHAPVTRETPRVAEAASTEQQLARHLVARGVLRHEDLQRALRLIKDADVPLGNLLVKLGIVSERHIAESLSAVFNLTLLEAADYPECPILPECLSLRFLKTRHLLPVATSRDTVTLAMANPEDDFAIQAVSLACQRPVVVTVGIASDIDAALEHIHGDGKSAMGRIVASIDGSAPDHDADIEHLKDLASEAPIIRLVNLIMQTAIDLGASDIHIEPFERQLKVRCRVDGFLRDIEAPPAQSTAAVISRIKLLAKLDIAERRLPQDGRIQLRLQGRELDVRVSSVPTLYGESIVLRLLETRGEVANFSALGCSPAVHEGLLECLKSPQGILLVTGPTGSGKTTTLYTALTTLNSRERKIITVEDPIEYQLDGVNQIQVKPQVGLTFVNALRSILRQDPDVIMIGEMRDTDTARIAVQSALTGHLVLSTLHTNDAPSAITRLLDMGVDDYLITSTVNAIVAQRLVRRLCQQCRAPYAPYPEQTASLQRAGLDPAGAVTLYRAAGCEVCGGTGYDGRIAIHELLIVSDAIRRLIMARADATQLAQAAAQAGMGSMRKDGFAKAIAGVTSIDEVMRVTQEAN